jgi:hypothetical protein
MTLWDEYVLGMINLGIPIRFCSRMAGRCIIVGPSCCLMGICWSYPGALAREASRKSSCMQAATGPSAYLHADRGRGGHSELHSQVLTTRP